MRDHLKEFEERHEDTIKLLEVCHAAIQRLHDIKSISGLEHVIKMASEAKNMVEWDSWG